MGLLRESSSRDRQLVLVYALVAVLFVVLYVVLFPRPLPAEFTLVPSQALPLTEVKADKLSPGGSFFVLGGWEGYWNTQGDLERVTARRAQSTAFGDKIAWYDATKGQLVVEGPQGMLFTVPGEQYPVWSAGRLFTVDENRMGLKAYSSEGRLQWSKHFASLVTAFDTSSNLTVVGTLDGRVQIFGPTGAPSGGFQPGGSRLSVIYNVAVAPRDGAILVLAGLDPKRFLVLERGGSEFRPVFHKPLMENRPWPTPLGFLNGGRVAYYQTEKGLAFLDPRQPDREVVSVVKGSPVLLKALPGTDLISFIERDGDRAALRVVSPRGASLLTLPFSARDLLLEREGQSLFLGADQTLLKLEVRIQ
jgi:hypothetical protein